MRTLPEKFLHSIQGTKGFNKDAFVDAHHAAPAVSIRKHPVKKSSAFSDCEIVPWCTEGRYLEKRPVFTLDPLLHAGAYYVQEASSMFLDHMLRALLPDNNNIRVLDLCAAPGGKSTLIASFLGRDSLLVSNEVIKTRVPVLEENLTRWGYMNRWVTNSDAKQIGGLGGYFDVIVVDAPCSGSGLFRKDEKAIDEWSEDNVALCSQRQKRIIGDAWPALKEGGLLIYSTCSYSSEENEMVLDWIADEFSVEGKTVATGAGWGVVVTSSAKHKLEGYRFSPDKLKGEGFFIAALQKNEGPAVYKLPKFRTAHDKKAYDAGRHLLKDGEWICIPSNRNNYIAINPKHEADMHLLSKQLYLKKTGTRLGAYTGKEWLPEHDIALSTDRAPDLPVINLSEKESLRFLKKEDPDISGIEKGWYIIQYEGLGLGWVKNIGNRFNNYLPKNLRIRMDINE